MDFTNWLEYEFARPIEDDYDYFQARQIWEAIFRPSLFFVGLNPR